jgi:hypothetical protein
MEGHGLDEEMDGMTITALTLWHLQPHHKVDMYSKIGAVKKMTLAQYDNDNNLFFDSIESVKLQIDSKDLMAYTDKAFVCDIFVQLKNELLPHNFKSEFTSLERQPCIMVPTRRKKDKVSHSQQLPQEADKASIQRNRHGV